MRRRDPCRPNFEDAQQSANAEFRRLMEGNPSVHQYHYRALSQNWEQYMLRDGVHLNNAGMGCYRKQVRAALCQTMKNVVRPCV